MAAGSIGYEPLQFLEDPYPLYRRLREEAPSTVIPRAYGCSRATTMSVGRRVSGRRFPARRETTSTTRRCCSRLLANSPMQIRHCTRGYEPRFKRNSGSAP